MKIVKYVFFFNVLVIWDHKALLVCDASCMALEIVENKLTYPTIITSIVVSLWSSMTID